MPLGNVEDHNSANNVNNAGIPSPRVVILSNGAPSPCNENRNFELDALYDMVPRPLASVLRQQTPSLLRNVVTVLLAQPYGLTWQELCINYTARYRETLICPITASGATMSPHSILTECCHRHDGLFVQDSPGKFRVRLDLLQCMTRPAVRKALLRLQEEAKKRLCGRCPVLLEPDQQLCPKCVPLETSNAPNVPATQSANTAVNSVDSTSQTANSISQSDSTSPPPTSSTSQPSPPSQPVASASQLGNKPAANCLMPSDFRDLTGGDLPSQILAVLPLKGLPFLQLPKAFQKKHGMSLKQQLKGKLAEFLETMSLYDLVAIDNKQGPLDRWCVRPLRTGVAFDQPIGDRPETNINV